MTEQKTYDIIIVGAGTGGGVLAARLGEAGKSVLVLEAGYDPLRSKPSQNGERDLSADYLVPAFNAFASENPGMRGDLWVRHYRDTKRQKQDWKFDAEKDGVLYPRVKGIGGCSAHHAMIIIKPNNRDWNHIAQITGDTSWAASKMQKYWERVERCRHRLFLWRWLAKLTGWNPTGHGWWGWLQTEYAVPLQVLWDRRLRGDILKSMGAAVDAFPGKVIDFESTNVDPNERRLWNVGASGIKIPPMSTQNHARTGARERLMDARSDPATDITLEQGAEVQKIVIKNGRAKGVIYKKDGQMHTAKGHEIVLAGGVFRTPQLMMLSGLGPKDHLKDNKIKPLHDLPGVGSNLQDRYEVGVVSEMVKPWRALKNVEYETTDKAYKQWENGRRGTYGSNGTLFAIELKSRPELAVPDLFAFSLLVDFQGYYQGYSERTRKKNYLTWAILKAYTQNTAGTVRLRSDDPDASLDVQFNYFDEGSDGWQEDLDAVVTGIRFVRKIADSMENQVEKEASPGRKITSDDDLRAFVKNNAWGHHACGTCAMKPKDQGGVVDSRFRVYGIDGLRIVDASIFPRIPGYFLVSGVYMIAEKAADVILEDMGSTSAPV